MRVLQIHPFLRGDRIDPRAGGKSRVALLLTRSLMERGHEVAVLPFPERLWGPPVQFEVGSSLPVRILPTMALPRWHAAGAVWLKARRMGRLSPGGTTLLENALYIAGLSTALENFKPDLIHSHQRHGALAALLLTLRPRVPLVFTHHTGSPGGRLELYDHVIFVSRRQQEEVSRATRLLRPESSVIYYPVESVFTEGGIPPAEQRQGLAFVGGLTRAKGLDLLLEAYRLDASLNALTLHLCGEGPEGLAFRDFAGQHKLNVVFEGRLDSQSLRGLLSHVRLLVNPSRLEGFSVAVLESLCCGTPVVGWAPQVEEIESRWGMRAGHPFDARVHSAAMLAETIHRALADTLQTTEARRTIADRARQAFSLERYAEANLELYRSLLQRRDRSAL